MRLILGFISSACATVCGLILVGSLLAGVAHGGAIPGPIDCDGAVCDGTCSALSGPCAAPCGTCKCKGSRGVYFCTVA